MSHLGGLDPRFSFPLPASTAKFLMRDSGAKFLHRTPLKKSRTPSSLCDIEDWDDPAFQSLAGRIMTGDPGCVFRHRKLWEFTRAVQAFETGGVWHKDALGLSVAAGHERLLFYAANHVAKMVASDVYGEGSFVSGEAREGFLQNHKGFAPYPYREESLSALWMNALSLEFPRNLFDFAFCLSSVEHFGGVSRAARAISEMAKVVSPGGIVFVTTDCSLNGRTTNEVFSQKQIAQLCEQPDLELLHPLDFSISNAALSTLLDMRADKLDVQPHINLKTFGVVFTSVALVFRKRGAALSDDSVTRARTLDQALEQLARSTSERRARSALPSGGEIQRLIFRARMFRWRCIEMIAAQRGEFALGSHQHTGGS
jgi:SAM-dependent methyltransferase